MGAGRIVSVGLGAWISYLNKHFGRAESIHIIEGLADLLIFDNKDKGEITDVMGMGEYKLGKDFYYRMAEELYHTIMMNSDVCVFHETTKGLF